MLVRWEAGAETKKKKTFTNHSEQALTVTHDLLRARAEADLEPPSH